MKTISLHNEAEIADAVREAAEKNMSFEILSGGTKQEFGRPVSADTILDVSALSGIVKYEPEELVLTARAGTKLTDIEAALAEKNQMLGFEPADWGPLFGAQAGRATLGGIVATNACGARRVKAGAVRDHVIGCRFVNGKGETIKAGGHVIKNVTGFDLPKLMCGAFGTLGVLTEITFRVSPRPERVAAFGIDCGAETGLRLLREAARLPLDASGLSYVLSDGGGTALIRVEGTHAAVEQKLAELHKQFAAYETKVLDQDATKNVFRAVSSASHFREIATDIWRLCVPAVNACDALTSCGIASAAFWYADWAGGLLWLGLPANDETAERLRGITARFGGHATLMRATRQARERLTVFEPETPARAEITRSVKTAFDPKRVLNPERMFQGV
ncbi:MAG TPA: glycolate oxidase subunit GlcE [Micropepsaceae bacterium]|jgi:glycolate oxidase FAD binding subunit|nr:glycolate oxidase subunit GlcE [Micropepsaceae bacterium]